MIDVEVLQSIAEQLPFAERQEFLHMNGLPNFFHWEDSDEVPTYTLTE
jgi:hypothetical protein